MLFFLTKPLKLFLSIIGKPVKKQHTSRLLDANNNSARNYVCHWQAGSKLNPDTKYIRK